MAEIRTVELNVETNSQDAASEFKRLHDEIALAQQELDALTQELGASNQATVQAQQKVNDLRGAYEQLNQTVTDVNGTFAQVYGETLQPLTTRLGEAEDRLYELALAGKQNTQEYKDLMAAAQGYLRTQQQVDLQVEAGSMPMAQKLTTGISGIAGAASAAEGAIALFGVESQAVQETLLKLNALLAITGGMQAIKEAIPIWENFGSSVSNGFAKMTTASKVFMVTGVGLLITGLGLLASNWDKVKSALSGTTVAQKLNNQANLQAISSISAELNAANKLQKQLKDETLTRKEKVQKIKEFQAAYPGLLQNMNLETMSIDQINEQLTKNIQLLKLQARQKAIQSLREETYKQILESEINLQTGKAKEEFQMFGVDIGGIALGSEATNGLIEFVTASEAAGIETNKVTGELNKNITALDKLDKANEKEMLALQKKGAQSRDNIKDYSQMATTTSNYTETVNKNAEALEKLRELRQRLSEAEKEYLTSLLSQEDQEKQAVREKYEALIREADKYNENSLLLREALDKGLADIDKKYRDQEKEEKKKIEEEEAKKREERIKAAEDEQEALNKQWLDGINYRQEAELLMAVDQERELLESRFAFQKELDKLNELQMQGAFNSQEEYNEALLNLEKKYQEKDKDIKDKYDKSELQKKKDKAFQIAQFTSDALNLVASIAEENAGKDLKRQKQAFNIRKAANLAQASIDGTKAVLSAFADTPGGIVFQTIAATIAGGFAALKIAQIAKSKFEGGGGGNDLTQVPSAPTSMVAQFNTVGSSGINQLAQLQQQPVQAYVVSGEVTSAQALDRNRVQNATL
jgi:hypothetical protein